mgnify:CR=1 FL=1
MSRSCLRIYTGLIRDSIQTAISAAITAAMRLPKTLNIVLNAAAGFEILKVYRINKEE